MDHRRAGLGARPPGSELVRSGDCWGRARPAAHASGSEAVATLATTRGQDGAAGAGAHPQTETVGLVPAAVVRLERALAQRIHSTQGGWTAVRSPGRATSRSPVGSQLAPLAHDLRTVPRCSWTCGTGRRRFRPANGKRCAATGSIRPNSPCLSGETRKRGTGVGTFFHRHAGPVDNQRRYLWTTVDPQVRRLLASMVPGSLTHA